MWERKTEKARWNGRVLHILSTTLDSGKRLYIAEMPYQEKAHIKVMGAKSRSMSIDAVFVGVHSLADANALVAELARHPEGVLDHPYLGELSLVYETSSQTFNTKKGLVTLSLTFIKQGTGVVLTRLEATPLSQLAINVIDASNKQFVHDIKHAFPEQIETMKHDFNTTLNAVRNMANRATVPSFELARLHRHIEDAFTAVEVIKNAPEAYTAHFSAMVESLKNVFKDSEITRRSDMAIEKISQTINLAAPFVQGNLHISVALVLLSDELGLLNHIEHVDIDTFLKQPLDKMQKNMRTIQHQLNNRVNEVSNAATFDRLVLVDAVQALRENINNQANKLTHYQQTLKTIHVVAPRPLLCIAQSNDSSGERLSRLNSIKHPLFVTGYLQVEHG